MILGPRILEQRNFDTILKAISPYVDVVDVHCYSTRPCAESLQHIHNITNKPILMSEFGFRARDSGLPNTKGAGPLLWTQSARAHAFETYVKELVTMPFVVGYHMFMYYDEPAGKQLFGADSNYGLVHQDGDVYTQVVEAFTR